MATSSKIVLVIATKQNVKSPLTFSQMRKKGHLLSAAEVPRECVIRKGLECTTSRTVFEIYSGSFPSVGRVL